MAMVWRPSNCLRHFLNNILAVLRIVDNKAILYFEASSTSVALNWFRGMFPSLTSPPYDMMTFLQQSIFISQPRRHEHPGSTFISFCSHVQDVFWESHFDNHRTYTLSFCLLSLYDMHLALA